MLRGFGMCLLSARLFILPDIHARAWKSRGAAHPLYADLTWTQTTTGGKSKKSKELGNDWQ